MTARPSAFPQTAASKRKEETVPFKANELMSSVSSVKAMNEFPSPMVYFPAETPSNFSSSS